MPVQFKTDFERKYRGEMTAMIEAGGYFPEEALKTPPDDDHPDGMERYKWIGGRLYQDGVLLAEWQMQQTMHHFRKVRHERCFEHCPICQKAGLATAERAKKKLKLGDPYEGERSGEYPCPNGNCIEQFNYQSHLMRHEEHEHEVTHDWKAFAEDLKANTPKDKCRYIGMGRYGKPCLLDALPGGLWCKNPKHMEQVQGKINKGLIVYQPDEVE